jgi:predicted nucleic acid-binding protein
VSRWYLDTSALLRVVLEAGASPEIEQALDKTEVLVTSRLTVIEAARAVLRGRQVGRLTDATAVDVEHCLAEYFQRAHLHKQIFERLTPCTLRPSKRRVDTSPG